MDLDLRRLSYFVAVADELHFGRAARRLHVAQPALSQQIRLLEKELGADLFTRTTRSVSLTRAGERLLERSRLLLDEADALVAEFRRLGEGYEGTIRLGFIGSASYNLMPAVVQALRQRYPHIRTDLTSERLSGPLAAAVHAGSLDIAVLRNCRAVEGLATRLLGEERICIALPADHRLAEAEAVDLRELADDPFVAFPSVDSTMHAAQASACRAAGFEPDVVAQVAETSTLITFVAAGTGVALVPDRVRGVRIPGVAYRPLLGEAHTVPLLAAWHPDNVDALIPRALDVVTACDGDPD